MGPHGHSPERAGRGGCCPRSRPSSHPRARASDHPRSITGWSPSTTAELEAAGVSEVSADPRELVYMPAPAPMPVRVPPSAAWDAVVDRYLSAAPVAVLQRPARRSRDDMMFDLQVKNILCCLEDFNNGVSEDDSDNNGAARRRRK